MSWITVPNEIVTGFTGKPIRAQKLNDDLEYVFKPIKCPSAGCEFSTTLLRDFQEHRVEEHGMDSEANVPIEPEMEDRNAAWLILETLLTFNRPDTSQRPNLLRRVQKGNDSHLSAEIWRRAWNNRNSKEVKLKKEQYDWLHQFLDRKIPLAATPNETREKKEQGEEPQTIAMYLFGLSEDTVRQGLTTLPERRRRELEPEDEPTSKLEDELTSEEELVPVEER